MIPNNTSSEWCQVGPDSSCRDAGSQPLGNRLRQRSQPRPAHRRRTRRQIPTRSRSSARRSSDRRALDGQQFGRRCVGRAGNGPHARGGTIRRRAGGCDLDRLGNRSDCRRWLYQAGEHAGRFVYRTTAFAARACAGRGQAIGVEACWGHRRWQSADEQHGNQQGDKSAQSHLVCRAHTPTGRSFRAVRVRKV